MLPRMVPGACMQSIRQSKESYPPWLMSWPSKVDRSLKESLSTSGCFVLFQGCKLL